MTLTGLNTINYQLIEERPKEPVEMIDIRKLPKIAWAAAGLLMLNFTVGVGMMITPDMQIDPYGRELPGAENAALKPSPFTETVDTSKHRVKLAAKAWPVTFVPPPVDAVPEATSSNTLEMNRTTPVSNVSYNLPSVNPRPQSSGITVYDADKPYDMPRVTYIPRRTEPAAHQTTVDISPRPVSEREKKFVVIN